MKHVHPKAFWQTSPYCPASKFMLFASNWEWPDTDDGLPTRYHLMMEDPVYDLIYEHCFLSRDEIDTNPDYRWLRSFADALDAFYSNHKQYHERNVDKGGICPYCSGAINPDF